MFSKIVLDIVNLFSTEPAAIAGQIPSMEIGMMAKAYFGIDHKSILRGRKIQPSNKGSAMIIAVHNDPNYDKIMNDVVISNGSFAVAMIIPYHMIEVLDNNAIIISKIVTTIVASYVELIANDSFSFLKLYNGGKAALVIYQAVPVLVTAIMRHLYTGPTLATVICNTLKMDTAKYKYGITEECIETIMSIFDEGTTVEDLLDNGFICTIPKNSKRYPGLWPDIVTTTEEDCSKTEEQDDSDD